MSIEKKLLGTTSGGDAPNVEDVFSTYLYDGNSSTQTITNGIDLSTEGGLVWMKHRSGSNSAGHFLGDTERGVTKFLTTNNTNGEGTTSSRITSFNSNGLTLGANTETNYSGASYASWTFRKAPRFFDVVTWTGNATNRTIAHDLGVAPGMVIVKRTDASASWAVYHRSISNTKYLILEWTNSELTGSHWNSTTATDSVLHLGTDGDVNRVSSEYVAYLFAHDPDGADDDGMIACGSYTGNGSTTGPVIDLGWEPQYILLRNSSSTSAWIIYDKMRGITTQSSGAGYGYGPDEILYPHLSNAETTDYHLNLKATGFQVRDTGTNTNNNGDTYIYMAIRAPMMKEPESATEVFAIDTQDGTPLPSFKSTFPIDMQISKYTSVGVPETNTRLTDKRTLETSSTIAEGAKTSASFAFMNGWGTGTGTDSTYYSWMFKRAKGFFDVVAYTGNSTAGRTVNHSLGVVPEMMIFKSRTGAEQWYTYHHGINGGVTPEDYAIYLNLTNTPSNTNTFLNDTAPTATNFTVHSGGQINATNSTYIAYLFATLDGVSKVGSYTGSTTNIVTVDCGFSNGARFVLIKRTDSNGDWMFFDTTRGITTGNDCMLNLNNTDAEYCGQDMIDPDSSGFLVNPNWAGSTNGGTYIFLAIA